MEDTIFEMLSVDEKRPVQGTVWKTPFLRC